MPMMPPFGTAAAAAGKATRSRGKFDPDGREMRRYEREFQAAMVRALSRLRRDVERGITAENVHDMVNRLSDPAVTRPFQDAIVTELQRVALAGAEHGRVTIEREVFGVKALEMTAWELANNAAAAWAIQFGQTLAGMMLMTTTERIQNEIAEYILNSQTIGELIERIRWGNVYSEERARMLAVTETTRAFAEGSMAAWRASGVIEKRRWNSNNDELVCPVCGPLNGVVVGLDTTFEGGISAPPAHPRCRCWVTPVVE